MQTIAFCHFTQHPKDFCSETDFLITDDDICNFAGELRTGLIGIHPKCHCSTDITRIHAGKHVDTVSVAHSKLDVKGQQLSISQIITTQHSQAQNPGLLFLSNSHIRDAVCKL